MTDLEKIDAPPELRQTVAACVKWSQENIIADNGGYQATADHLQEIKAQLKAADAFFDGPIKTAHELHKTLVARKKFVTDPLKESEATDKRKMLGFTAEQQRKAEEERRKLQAAADESARREREALEKRAAAAKRPETQERLREEAALVEAPVIAVAAPVPKVAGITTRRTWKAEVVDISAFCNAVIEYRRADLILPNMDVLTALAKGLGERAEFPGVKFFQAETMGSRSK